MRLSRLSTSRPASSTQSCGAPVSLAAIGLLSLVACPWFAGSALAAPQGGNIVGGSGSISQVGTIMSIRQNSAALAIDWNSYNLNVNEVVNYIQPGASSIALNRIVGGGASQIHGRINANGQVVLVNPNGIFFGRDAIVNVGGLIASGLDIDPVDFINGDYVFGAVEGTSGAVVNGGILNASLGGSITLLGRQVENSGLISADLGTVNLAAGKAAVLTFDHGGLLGVRVTEAVLQDEFGVDPAVLNRGQIEADSGRVLLTANQSRDVFSDAVNHAGIEQARSVVLHADGSFTLGGGDIENSGVIDVSGAAGGRAEIFGNNVEHSGEILADASAGAGGEVELYADDTLILSGQAAISAGGAERGGAVRLLGDKVGLFDHSRVDASAAQGGGEILIGGDRQGRNAAVRNASFTFLGEQARVAADALANGDGGEIIAFATDTARIHGEMSARGGARGGDGGFIETSGLRGFEIGKTPDLTAARGNGGEWLIDPHDITIVGGGGNTNITAADPFVSSADGASLGVDLIVNALSGNATVSVITATDPLSLEAGNISLQTDLDFSGTGSNTLTLQAHNSIIINGQTISGNAADQLSLQLVADSDAVGGGDVVLTDAEILTSGGNFSASGANFSISWIGSPNDTIDTGGGDLNLNMSGNVVFNDAGLETGGGNIGVIAGGNISVTDSEIDSSGGTISFSGVDFTSIRAGVTTDTIVSAGGDITLAMSGNITLGAEIASRGGDLIVSSSLNFDNSAVNGLVSAGATIPANAGDVSITTSGNAVLGFMDARGDDDTRGGSITVNAGGNITLTRDYDFFNTYDTDNTLTFNAANDININASIFDSTTGERDTLDVVLNADSDGSSAGNINIGADIFTGGGNFDASGVNFVSSGQIINTNNSNAGGDSMSTSGGHVSLTMGGGVTLGTVVTEVENAANGDLNIIAGGTVVDATGNLDINGITRITAGANDVTLDNANDFGNGVRIVSANNVTLVDIDAIALGNGEGVSTVTGNLNITADGDISNGGVLAVGGSATFVTTQNDADIIVDQAGNSFAGAISATTTGTNQADIAITNTAALTTLGAVTAFGDVTLNADGSLTMDGALAVSESGSSGAITANLNFGLNGAPAVFNLGVNGSVTATSSGSSDSVTINVNGGNGGNQFNFDPSTTVSLSGNSSLNFNGGNQADTFNVSLGLPASLDGGAGNDILNAPDIPNDWSVTGTNRGTLTAGGETTGFDDIERLNGGLDVDSLTGPDQNVSWSIAAGSGNLANGANLLTTGFFGFENYTGGSGDDNFVIAAAGGFGIIDGGGENATGDTLDLSARASNSILLGIDVVDIENVVGNGADSTLVAPNLNNDWTVTGVNAGVIDNSGGMVGFTGFNNLTGNAATDTFVFNAGGAISGVIDAATGNDVVDYSNLAVVNISLANAFNGVLNAETIRGNDVDSTLTGQNVNNTWNITGDNDGSVGAVAFEDFNNLVGGSATDNFVFSSGASLSGNITGGAGADSVDYSALNNFSVDLGQDISAIEQISGNSSSSTLIGANIDNTWNITAVNAGIVGGVAFTGFNNLTGGSADDSFVIASTAATISGNLDGGGQTLADVVDYSTLPTVDVGAGDFGGFPNIERILGNATNSTLTGSNQVNTWTLTNAGSGSIGTLQFSGFNSLVGGNQQDTFNFSGNSAFTSVDGATGDDAFNVTLSGAETGNLSLIGNAGNDSLNLIGGTAGYAGQYSNLAPDQGQFVYSQGGNVFSVAYSTTETVNDDLIASSLAVDGSVGADLIQLEANRVTVNGETIGYLNKTTLSVDALGGVDTIDISGNVNLAAGNLILSADSITNSSGSSITALALTFSSVASVGTAGSPIVTSVDSVAFANVSGDVFVTEQNGLRIDQLNVLGSNVALTAQLGDVTDGGSLISNANLQLVAQNGSILLNNANQFGGNISLSAVNGTASLNNTVATLVDAIVAQNLIIASGGAISETPGAAIVVSNGTALSTSAQSVTLVNPGHRFTRLAVSGATELNLADSNGGGLILDNVGLSGNATVSTAGDLGVGLVSAGGDLNLTTPGAVGDVNGGGINLITPSLILSAANGIGTGDAIETQVSAMNITNSTSGEIRLQQNGTVNLIALQNTGALGDINFVGDSNINFSPGSVVAALGSGSGDLFMSTSQGSFLGLGVGTLANPDITAQNAIFFGRAGNFGSLQRPLTLNVPGIVLIDTRGFFDPLFVPPGPSSLDTTGIDFGVLASISSILGDQLVDVESLGAIDPAIFTELKNYNSEEVSILLPRDQLFEDELEEEEE